MNLTVTAHLARVFLKIFFRDRSAFVLGTLFPVAFLLVLGSLGSQDFTSVQVGLVSQKGQPSEFASLPGLLSEEGLEVTRGSFTDLLRQMEEGELLAVLIPPAGKDGGQVEVLMRGDRAAAALLPFFTSALVAVERRLQGLDPVFHFAEAAEGQPDYVLFLLPGLLAFSIMQISFAGSGYNLVEYRRKGILKRLFVTPLRPAEFILAISLARTLFCLLQLTLVVLFAKLVMQVSIPNAIPEILLLVALGCFIFLSLGFALGSVLGSQQAIGAMGSLITFPQIVLSGVFFPVELLPELLALPAAFLPLTFLVSCLRGLIAEGASLVSLLPALAGLAIWCLLAFVFAVWLFDWRRLAN